MQPGSRPSGRERPIRVADVEGSGPASTILDSGIEGKAVCRSGHPGFDISREWREPLPGKRPTHSASTSITWPVMLGSGSGSGGNRGGGDGIIEFVDIDSKPSAVD